MSNEAQAVAIESPVVEIPMRTVIGFQQDNTFLEEDVFEGCGGEAGQAFAGEDFETLEVPAAATDSEVMDLVESHFAKSEEGDSETDEDEQDDIEDAQLESCEAIKQMRQEDEAAHEPANDEFNSSGEELEVRP
jgi:hypothetical protein